MTTSHAPNWLNTINACASRFARPVRDALIIVGTGRALWSLFVQYVRPWEFAGVDARAYWQVDLVQPYIGSGVRPASSRREWWSSRSSTASSGGRTSPWWRLWR